jgi:hypothetical protein
MPVNLHIFLILITSMITLVVISSYNSNYRFLDRITTKIPNITGVFLAINVYLTYRIFYNNFIQSRREYTHKISYSSWVLINNNINKFYNDCPAFIESLYFPWQRAIINNILHNKPHNSAYQHAIKKKDSWTAINYISVLIFQSWEDILTAIFMDNTGEEVWIATGLQWANSKQLKKVWDICKHNYDETTVRFAELLFETSQKIKFKNTHEIMEHSIKIKNSSRYHDIIHDRLQALKV